MYFGDMTSGKLGTPRLWAKPDMKVSNPAVKTNVTCFCPTIPFNVKNA
jgi:hypothetical protein